MANDSSLTLTYTTLLSSTLMKVLGTSAVRDQIFLADPLWEWLKSGDRLKVIDGGERIRIPILYGKNSSANSYADYEPLDLTALAA